MGIYTPPWYFSLKTGYQNTINKREQEQGNGGGCDRVDGLGRGKKVAESPVKKIGAKPIDNFLTQSRVKERNEKHQKRKKERKD